MTMTRNIETEAYRRFLRLVEICDETERKYTPEDAVRIIPELGSDDTVRITVRASQGRLGLHCAEQIYLDLADAAGLRSAYAGHSFEIGDLSIVVVEFSEPAGRRGVKVREYADCPFSGVRRLVFWGRSE